VKSSNWTVLLQRITRYGWCAAAIVLGNIAAGDCFAADPSFEYLNVTVEDISYQGNNKYRVDITLLNRSGETIVLKEHSAAFYVQTEILGRWKELSVSPDASDEIIALLPRKAWQAAYMLNIPLDGIPPLYTNSEGDINMMFRYRMRFVPGSETGLRSSSGESSYWITPKTDAWILREGM
jgi:hypothetical protein